MSSRLRGFPARGPEKTAVEASDLRIRVRTLERRLARTAQHQTQWFNQANTIQLTDAAASWTSDPFTVEVPDNDPFVTFDFSGTYFPGGGTTTPWYAYALCDVDYPNLLDSSGNPLDVAFLATASTYFGTIEISVNAAHKVVQVEPGTREFSLYLVRTGGAFATVNVTRRNFRVSTT